MRTGVNVSERCLGLLRNKRSGECRNAIFRCDHIGRLSRSSGMYHKRAHTFNNGVETVWWSTRLWRTTPPRLAHVWRINCKSLPFIPSGTSPFVSACYISRSASLSPFMIRYPFILHTTEGPRMPGVMTAQCLPLLLMLCKVMRLTPYLHRDSDLMLDAYAPPL